MVIVRSRLSPLFFSTQRRKGGDLEFRRRIRWFPPPLAPLRRREVGGTAGSRRAAVVRRSLGPAPPAMVAVAENKVGCAGESASSLRLQRRLGVAGWTEALDFLRACSLVLGVLVLVGFSGGIGSVSVAAVVLFLSSSLLWLGESFAGVVVESAYSLQGADLASSVALRDGVLYLQVWRCCVAFFPRGGSGPARCCDGVDRVSPLPASVSRRSWLSAGVEGAADLSHGVRVDGARWRLFGVRGSATSRPQGGASDPRFKGGAAAARRRHVLLVVDVDEF